MNWFTRMTYGFIAVLLGFCFPFFLAAGGGREVGKGLFLWRKQTKPE